jgi:hypothetical protein
MMVICLDLAVSLFVAGLTVSASSPQRQGPKARPDQDSWSGTYTNSQGNSFRLEYALAEQDGQRCAKVKFTDPDGEHSAVFTLTDLDQRKFKGKFNTADNLMEVNVEGEQRDEDHLTGTYSISRKGSPNTVDQGRWNLARRSVSKPHS